MASLLDNYHVITSFATLIQLQYPVIEKKRHVIRVVDYTVIDYSPATGEKVEEPWWVGEGQCKEN